MNGENSLFLEGLSEGEVVKLRRMAKGLRQIDIAAAAYCEQSHIIDLEKDRWVRPDIRERVLVALGLWEEVGDD
jgi:transcriptional regulator with XRE-family HTH domain